MNMSSDEEALIKELGITSKTTTVYLYDGYTYAKLEDAVKYAQIKINRKDSDSNRSVTSTWFEAADTGATMYTAQMKYFVEKRGNRELICIVDTLEQARAMVQCTSDIIICQTNARREELRMVRETTKK